MTALAEDLVRYADLICRQIEALALDDLACVSELATQRDQLATRIERQGGPLDAEARVIFQECIQLDAELVARLAELRTSAFQDLKAGDQRRPGIRAYGSAAMNTSAFDRRL